MYNTSHTEDFVKEMYTNYGILKPQQLNFQYVAAKLGISVFYWKDSSQALFLKEYPYIFLNENLTKQQINQEFYHELGHVLLHTGNQRQMTESFRRYQESKANHFMYHACVPTFMLNKINPKLISVKYISKLFNVEEEFARKRLEQYINKVSLHLESQTT